VAVAARIAMIEFCRCSKMGLNLVSTVNTLIFSLVPRETGGVRSCFGRAANVGISGGWDIESRTCLPDFSLVSRC